jgi:hypothetical protein
MAKSRQSRHDGQSSAEAEIGNQGQQTDGGMRYVEVDPSWFHAYNGYMQKIQVLFPEPQMEKLRKAAKRQDRPISEIIRKAVDDWLNRSSSLYDPQSRKQPPRFHGGAVMVSHAGLRDSAYQDRMNFEQH